MPSIQSNIGLITGIPIGDIVDQLMQISSRPRKLLVERTSVLKSEQVAVTDLSAKLLSLQFIVNNLKKASLYDERKVTSSDSKILSATLSGSPAKGSYQFTPLGSVQSQQLVSSGFKSDVDPLGGGTVRLRFGADVRRSVSLDAFGGGEGFDPGKIRITDRSGASAVVDLTAARSVDDVLAAISENADISVTAVAHGDGIRLMDTTGQAVSNLKVEEVGGGTTAASLGLAGINVAAGVADGQDMLRLDAGIDIDALNDGNGVRRDPVFADIHYTLRDGTQGNIDLSPIIPGSSKVDKETSLGEILGRINAAAPDKLKIEIAPDGDRLMITDLTAGEGAFALSSLHDSKALAGLGLEGAAVDGVITGRRLIGGVQTVLLASLNGGNGLGQLGSIQLTDRSGDSDSVDLAGSETLEEVIERINAAAVGVTAAVNAAGNGIELVDTSAGPLVGNLIVASGDATGTAEKLGIAVDADAGSVAGGDMHLQTIAENTLLSRLNGGAGVAAGEFQVRDSAGRAATVDLSDEDVRTVGDVIRAINRLDVNVVAELNETGDGIRLRDLAGGSGTMQVSERGSTAAADLHILGSAVETDVGGEMVQVIDGSSTYTLELDAGDSLSDLRDKINELGAGVTATTFNDGSGKPYRLTLSSNRGGKAGRMVVDVSGIDLGLKETVAAEDALLMLGSPASPGAKVLVSSSSNTFKDVLAGVTLQIQQASSSPVTVSVTTSDTNVVANVKTLVDNYNKFREALKGYTKYNAETDERSVLTGNSAALRLDTDMARLMTGRFYGTGSIQSLAELGIEVKQDGTLGLNESQLTQKLQSDRQAVEDFFTDGTLGFSAKLGDLIDGLAGEDTSLLSHRLNSLNRKIEVNDARVELMTSRLSKERDRLLLRFYRLEAAIGKMQNNLSAVGSIQALPPLWSTRKN
jgi:flagellar hook-associated protein 2